MSDQLTIRLPEEMNRALEAASTRMRRKRSEIVRLALSQFLDLQASGTQTPAARVRHLIGSLESGIPDLAENHRQRILLEIRTEPPEPVASAIEAWHRVYEGLSDEELAEVEAIALDRGARPEGSA